MEFVHKHVHTSSIRMPVVEAGSGFPVLFCHGAHQDWLSRGTELVPQSQS